MYDLYYFGNDFIRLNELLVVTLRHEIEKSQNAFALVLATRSGEEDYPDKN